MEKIRDVVVHDIVTRVIGDLFPDTKWEWFTEAPDEVPSGSFLVEYVGDLDYSSGNHGLIVSATGPLQTKEAQQFVQSLPRFLLAYELEDKSLESYGEVARRFGLYSARHPKFDNRLISSHISHDNPLDYRTFQTTLPGILETLHSIQTLRYESKAPEVSVILTDSAAYAESERHLGYFTPDLFVNHRSLTRLCADGAASLELSQDGTVILDVVPLQTPLMTDEAIPRNLFALAKESLDRQTICVNLDDSPAIQIFSNGKCRFRQLNHRYVWLDGDHAISYFVNPEVGRRLVSLAADLANRGHGAILSCVDKNKHKEVLARFARDDCVPYIGDTWDSKFWTDAVSSLGKFNAWLLKRGRNVMELPHSLLLNLCSADGVTFFDTEGELLGYGAIIRTEHAQLEAGARTTAAKYLSKLVGPVVKVSEDRHAVVFADGEFQARIW